MLQKKQLTDRDFKHFPFIDDLDILKETITINFNNILTPFRNM